MEVDVRVFFQHSLYQASVYPSTFRISRMASNCLEELHKATIGNLNIELLLGPNVDSDKTKDISTATHLLIPPNNKIFSLTEQTNFVTEGKIRDLKTVYQCWLLKDATVTEYISDCQRHGVDEVSFLHRTDLNTWLVGSSESCEYLVDNGTKNNNNLDTKIDTVTDKSDSKVVKKRFINERVLIDHNINLRGTKYTSFASVIKQSDELIINKLNHKKPVSSNSGKSSSTSSSSSLSSSKRSRNNDPIILVSPSASSLITMSNIKEFFEDGKFLDPSTTSSDSNILRLSHSMSNKSLGRVRFLVVSDTAKFTKTKDWDRVVAIITTGQLWQFKEYHWTNPNELFRHAKGYFFSYKGDIVPESIKGWNVDVVTIDRTRRFRDREVMVKFWDGIEKYMIERGWINKLKH